MHSNISKGAKQTGDSMSTTWLKKAGKIVPMNNIIDLNTDCDAVDTSTSESNKKNRKRKNSDASAEHRKKSKKGKWNITDKDEAKLETDTPAVETVSPAKVLSDMSAWKKLFVPVPVLKALRDQGFTAPTTIQAFALPSAIRDHLDIIGAAETGSGKTLAFGIPILNHILTFKEKQNSELSVDCEREDNSAQDQIFKNDSDDTGSDSGLEVQGDSGSDEESLNSESEAGNTVIDLDNIPIPSKTVADESDDSELFDNPPEEDETIEIEDDQLGCTRVMNDVDFVDDMEIEEPTEKAETSKPLLALILEPTRELAIQVKNHLMAAAKYTDIQIATVVGGMSTEKQQRILRRCPEIVIATPGRLWELIQEREPHLSKIEGVHQLVIDEADRMVEKGHFEELTGILQLVNSKENSKNKSKRQTFVFSATLTMLHSGPQRHLGKKKTKEKMDVKLKLERLMTRIGIKERPKVIDVTRKTGTAETLTEARINCTTNEKDIYLYYFLKQHPGRTLVFANSKDCIRRLVSIFTLLGCHPLPLHADMHQRQRLKNLDKFTGNKMSLLLASDVAARGLDIPNVDHVVHYQVPPTIENYVHRSGRTARASREGLSVMLVGQEDVRNYRKIIANLNKSEDISVFPVEMQYIPALTARVAIARKIDIQELRFKKKKLHNEWFQKAAEEMDLALDESQLLDMGDTQEQKQHQQQLKQMRSELSMLLKQSLVPRTFSGKYPTRMGMLVLPTSKEADAITKVKKDLPSQQNMMRQIAAKQKLINKKNVKTKTKKFKSKKQK
ncbi:ATP-dependent RNA helicase DDX24-like [Gigantopelta aegis]|uniref:ATP-dependent RNA helicase DDX24-like n=1 Tax=Gigantopelta aegis TaxID=1735272 RepID=UPI001B88DC38|nr:ATP-dependent RNA helicase DDX24-like [Gigantopelta aegis]